MTVVVVAEVVLLCGLAAAWAAGEAAPQGWSLLNLILLAAVTMGMQSAAVRSIGGAGITTTFITGTWADLVSGLMGLSGVTENRLRRAAAIATYVLGAALGGIVVIRLPPWTAPLLPAALLAVAASSAVLLLRAEGRR